MFKYTYTGETVVNVPGVGTFEPGETKQSPIEISNPDFELVAQEGKKKK